MTKKKYKMSFSTGGIFYHESLILAELYLVNPEWKEINAQALEENLLQTRTKSTAKRIVREIISRLKQLSSAELSLLVKGDRVEQNSILWIAVCRNYEFIREFSVEVIREYFLTYQYQLSYDDFDAFFYKKADWYEELDNISESTRKKLRQVLFKMMREVDLIDKDKSIIPAVLSQEIIDIITAHRKEDLSIFPTL